MMKRAGVIGYPLEHSISPAVFQAAIEATGVDASYEAWETPPDQLEGRLNALRGDDFLGANVTIPHKESVVALLDSLSGPAEAIGAVNTIASNDGQLVGHNTDVAGFTRALRDDAGFDPQGKRVAIIGSGGAARAVAYALVEARAIYICVMGRSPRRNDRLVAGLRAHEQPGTTVTWAHWGDGVFLTFLPKADLVVNCTPVGTKGSEAEPHSPVDSALLPEHGVIFDLVYNPPETPLLRAARERGATGVSGLGMLVYQAAESFRIWTGTDAPVDVMLSAGKKALGM